MTNKFDTVEIVNRRYLNPRNVIAALTDKLDHQNDFQGVGLALGLNITDDLDPTGVDGGDIERAVPPEPILLVGDEVADDIQIGSTVEEMLTESSGAYFTTLPFAFFRGVWFDGLMARATEHWTVSGTDRLTPNSPLLSGTEVYGRYVVGTE